MVFGLPKGSVPAVSLAPSCICKPPSSSCMTSSSLVQVWIPFSEVSQTPPPAHFHTFYGQLSSPCLQHFPKTLHGPPQNIWLPIQHHLAPIRDPWTPKGREPLESPHIMAGTWWKLEASSFHTRVMQNWFNGIAEFGAKAGIVLLDSKFLCVQRLLFYAAQ